MLVFSLNPRLDVDQWAARFAQHGRVSIPDLLDPDCAMALHQHLRARADWVQMINSADKLVELTRDQRAQMPAETAAALDQAVYAGARQGFQYRYEAIRVPDKAAERIASDDPLAAFAHWWSGPDVLPLLARIAGDDAIRFGDAQATAYAPGDFLTGHDDDFAGKDRSAAYVMGLTPIWRTEWGGLLLFHDDAHAAVQGLVPAFNTLNMFRVPQMHSVSEVSRAAAYRRYAITGWLRRSDP